MISSDFQVTINGKSVTSQWFPPLLSISVSRAAKETGDTADISLSDPDGSTVMPGTGDEIGIYLGGGKVFEGFVDSARSTGDKKNGRTIAISSSSIDHKSKVKAAGLRSAENKTFGEIAVEWGKKSGLEVSVAGDLKSVDRDYWIMQNESFMSWGQRMARDLGASFKIIGKRGFFAPLNEGISVTGKKLTTIVGRWGDNLFSWDITPITGRPQYGKSVARHYDIKTASWVEVEVSVKDSDVDVEFRPSLGSANPKNAKQSAGSSSKDSEREKGGGSVVILGDYAPEPEASFSLVGARPGIDGTYIIDALTHSYSKGDGFVTKLDLKLPKDGAGKDFR